LKLTIDAFPDYDEEESVAEVDGDESDGNRTNATTPESFEFALPQPPLWGFLVLPVEGNGFFMNYLTIHCLVSQTYSVLAVKDNVGHHVPPPGGLESPGFLDLPLQWFNGCVANHATCRESVSPAFYPSRLLEIVSEDLARLVITREHPPEGRYASLSHCWGKAKTLKLLQSNLDQLCAGVAIPTLPTSYREAITVCRRFGLRYIWIDSLCIMQDSREDWQREAITMKDVYRNSALNIEAAAAAESSEASFLSRDPEFIRPVQVTAEWDIAAVQEQYYLVDEALYDNDVKDSPLHQRAWVMQEVLLTTRSLSLTQNQLWFECTESHACETYPGGLPAALVHASDQARVLGLPSDRLAHTYQRWSRVVEKYAACFLTFPGDKMIAFAGIAQHFQGLLPGDTYVAGMWRSQLPWTLNWRTHNSRPCYRPEGYRAPSWSWASLEGPVQFEHQPAMAVEGTLKTPCVVLDVVVQTVDQHETGLLRGGYIQMKAPLIEVGILCDSLTLETSPGQFEYIEGSNEAVGSPRRGGSWTSVQLDECTPDGSPALSYLGPLTEQACLACQMDSLARVRESVEDGMERHGTSDHLFAMPIAKFLDPERWFIQGIMLLWREEWPSGIYQRVGWFLAAGDVAVNALEERSTEQLVTVI
jgi:hypothetical protein